MKAPSARSHRDRLSDILVILLCLMSAGAFFNLFRLDLYRTLERLNETPVGIITFKYKIAQRRFIDRVLWDRLRNESPVYNGDTIRTAEISEATITLAKGEVIDLAENSLIRILVDRNSAVVELGSGSVNAGAGAVGGLTLVSGDTRIVLASSSVVNAVSAGGADGTAAGTDASLVVRVVEGSARLEAADRMVLAAAGEALTAGTGEPALVTVTSPLPNARYYSPGAALEVPFGFTRQHFSGDVRLELALDRGFTQSAADYVIAGDAAVIRVAPGVYFWRAYPVEGGDAPVAPPAAGRLSVIAAPPPRLFSPGPGEQFGYRSSPPALQFRWEAEETVTSALLEVADNPDMRSPAVSIRVRTSSIRNTDLGAGRWYWRISPEYFREYSGPPSAVSSFTIEQHEALAAPGVIASPDFVNISGGPSSLSWQKAKEAVSYTVYISEHADLRDPVITAMVADNRFVYDGDREVLKEGTYYWAVSYTDRTAESSPLSSIQSFHAVREEVIQHSLFPPDAYTIAVSLLPDFNFTWKTNLAWRTRFQIAADPDFSRMVVNEEITGESFRGRSLPGGTYWWRIIQTRGETVLGTEARSFTASGPLAEISAAKQTPSENGAIVIHQGEATAFHWDAVPGADYYRFRIYHGDGREPVYQTLTAGTDVSLDLHAEGNYTWMVQAFADESSKQSRQTGLLASSGFTLRTLKPVTLDTPRQGASITGLEALGNPGRVQWSSVERISASRFILSRSRVLAAPVESMANPPVSVQLPRLSPGTYYWTIRAETPDGYDVSAPEPSWFTVLPIPPLPAAGNPVPPDGFLVNMDYLLEHTSIEFSWDPVNGASRYILRLFFAGVDGGAGRGNDRPILSEVLTGCTYVLEDLSVLDQGRFRWDVEAQYTDEAGALIQGGNRREDSFTVDISRPVKARTSDIGEIYGVESVGRKTVGGQQ